MANLLVCPHCGFSNTPGAAFCGNCGRSLVEAPPAIAAHASQAVFCPYCERENPIGATFCGHCGQSLTADGTDMSPRLIATNVSPQPTAQSVGRRRPHGCLLALILLAGVVLVLASVAFILLPRLDLEWPPALAGLLGVEPTAVPARPSDEPTPEPSSRAAGDLATYTLFQNEANGNYAFWLIPQNGQPAFLATDEGQEYSAEVINAGSLDEQGVPESIPGWKRLANPDIVHNLDALANLTFGDPTSGFRMSGRVGIAENVRIPTKEPPVTAGEEDTVVVAEAPSATATLPPTVTPFPTNTPRPTLTPLPTRTPLPPTPPPSPTPIPLPTNSPQPTRPPVVCQTSPGDRWGPTLWDRNKERLGCATTGEIRSNAAYQYYQHGMMVWRETPDLVYVLYNDGTFDTFAAAGPDGYFDSDWLKGSFGYLWNNNAAVRNQIGQPEAAEFNATNFAAQDFAGGTIFYFLENDARNYVLFDGSGTWISAQE